MKIALGLLLLVHGLIHLMGFAKGWELARIDALTTEVTRTWGLVWLLATLLLTSAAVTLFALPRLWWGFALAGVVVSQVAIVSAWPDAKFGTLANLIIAACVVPALSDLRHDALGQTFRREVALGLARSAPTSSITEADLTPLPPLLATWLRRVGVVGRPRPTRFRALMHGRIRNGLDAPWLDFRVEQWSFLDRPTRLFHLVATKAGLPVEVLHHYRDGEATMRGRVASLVPILDGSGPLLSKSETVTWFNDLCVMAPGALVDPAITWREGDSRSVVGTLTVGPHTVSATLVFGDDGDLVDFWSDDRMMSADGKTFEAHRWSTPIRAHRDLGGLRLPSAAEAVWALESGPFPYATFVLDRVDTG